MNTLTDYQIINDKAGNPAFVVIPYEDFKQFKDHIEDDNLILPDEIVKKTIMEDKSLLCAWRECRQLKKQDMALKMKIIPDEYDAVENKKQIPEKYRKTAADILGIDARLLID